MEISSYEKHQGNLNTIFTYYYVKKANMKAIYCISPTIWYSEKIKTVKRDSLKKKISDCQELRESEKYVGGVQRTFKQWNWAIWYYNNRHMTHICPSWWNVQHLEWILNFELWARLICQSRFIDYN